MLSAVLRRSTPVSNFLRCITHSKIGVFHNSSNTIRSAYPDLVMPQLTLPEIVFADFGKYPKKTAIECAETGRKYTFEEVRTKSINLNKALRKMLKLGVGDVVAVILPNVPEYPICVFGSLLANLKVTTANPAGTIDEMQKQMMDTNVKVIFTTCTLESHIRLLRKALPVPVPTICIKTNMTDSVPQGCINFNELVDVTCDIDDQCLMKSDDVAIIPYSSGTTGLQKGVLHSHYSIAALYNQISSPVTNYMVPTTENYQDSVPVVLPFFHIYGLTCLLVSQLSILSKLVTMTKFIPDVFLRILEVEKPRTMCIVPPIVLFLNNNPAVTQKHLESFQYIISGAAPLGGTDEKKLEDKMNGKINVYQGYGLTEAPVLTVNIYDNPVKGSVGPPTQNTEMKVVPTDNVSGDALKPYEEGEILARGPQVMIGYHNRSKETEDAFADGWLRTGDLGYYDEHNNFFIKDRLKELIKVKGFQVPPAELEELIRNYPSVTDAVVIGIPHDKYGEVPRAYITVKSNTNFDLNDLERFVTDKVSKYKRIVGGFSIVESLPRTASGKYLRRQLKNQYLQNNV